MTTTNFSSVGDQQLTVSSSAVSLTPPTDKTPRHALIFIGGAAVRWLGGAVDSTTPTSAIGIKVEAGGYIEWTHPEGDYWGLIQNAQFIATGADATLEILYLV